MVIVFEFAHTISLFEGREQAIKPGRRCPGDRVAASHNEKFQAGGPAEGNELPEGLVPQPPRTAVLSTPPSPSENLPRGLLREDLKRNRLGMLMAAAAGPGNLGGQLAQVQRGVRSLMSARLRYASTFRSRQGRRVKVAEFRGIVTAAGTCASIPSAARASRPSKSTAPSIDPVA